MTADDIKIAIADLMEQLEDIQRHESVLFLECDSVVDIELIADALIALRELYEQINT